MSMSKDQVIESMRAALDRQAPADALADLRARWLPSAQAMSVAAAMLADQPGAMCVVVALVQPGKVAGVWEPGQQVLTVPGHYWLVGYGDGSDVRYTSYRRGTAAAIAVGEAALAETDQMGTVAYALIERGGQATVFEY